MCTICKTYQPIVKNITLDDKPARTAKDVLGHILKCGHKFGNKDFMKIQEAVNEIRLTGAKMQQELDDEIKNRLNKVLASLTAKGKVD